MNQYCIFIRPKFRASEVLGNVGINQFKEQVVLRSHIAARIPVFFLALLLVLGLGNDTFAQAPSGASMDEKIEQLKAYGSEGDPTLLANLHTIAAQMYLMEGNQEKAVERIEQALQMCRDQNLDRSTDGALMVASMVMRKMDADGASEFLEGQLEHPNASDAYKKAVRQILGQQLEIEGDLVSSITTAKAALDAVQKEAPGSVEEAESQLNYGQKCLTSKLFDLGLPALQRTMELGEKLNRTDLSDRAAQLAAMGFTAIDKDEEASKILVKQIASMRQRGDLSQMSSLQNSLARAQIRLGEFAAATNTIDDLVRESEAGDGTYTSYALSLRATNLFVTAVADGQVEKTVPLAITTLKKALEDRTKQLTVNGQDMSEVANAFEYLTLAVFQSVAGNDDAAMKTLDRAGAAINAMAIQYEKAVAAGYMDSDETSVIIADQRSAIAELRQTLLVRAGQVEEALVVAEQSRGAAQAEVLKRRLGIEQGNKGAEITSVAQIQAIADDEKTTLVYYSLIHALDPMTRGFYKKSHTVNSPQSLYIWVVRPQEKIEFVSKVLPVRINDLVSVARDEIVSVVDDAEGQETVQDDERLLATDANVVRLLTRSGKTVSNTEADSAALRQLYQLLITPIEKWLPESPEEIVTFVPQGNLFVLPFAALTGDDNEPLIANHTLSISPSAKMATLADQEFQSVKQKNNQGIVIVGNPTMPSYQSRPDKPAVQLSPLPGAEAEANYIAELFKVKAICGDAADELSVIEAMKNAKYIHLATHGLLEADNTYAQSYLSSLALTPSKGEDGFLTVRETMQLNLSAEQAVLSGCDTGRGRISGDGVVGLARGYISAGIPTVVVSLWPVSDNSTAFLMAIYYKELIAGEAKAVALRNAMLKTRERFASPHAWAAFTLYGYSR